MNASQLSLENFAGYTGVGALQILGWFFVIDGLTGFYSLVEQYASSASWQIFFSVALVALAYLLGTLPRAGRFLLLERLVLRGGGLAYVTQLGPSGTSRWAVGIPTIFRIRQGRSRLIWGDPAFGKGGNGGG